MKRSQTCGCLLLFSALLNWGSCWKNVKTQTMGGPGVTYRILIAKCLVPAPANLKQGTIVVWYTQDNKPYTITFIRKFDLNNNEITPSPNPLSFSPPTPQGTATWDTQQQHTPTDCDDPGGGGCYFQYKIAPSNGGACSDPGIRIEQ